MFELCETYIISRIHDIIRNEAKNVKNFKSYFKNKVSDE
jgi:hypothetical protein